VRDHEASEDIVQQVFMKFWDKRERLNPTLEVKPYLFVAVKNTSLNYLKVSKRTAGMEDEQFINLNPEKRTAEDDMELQELEATLQKVIKDLPPKCQQVFVLSRFEEKSYKEIAAEMEISVKTVENQMGKALRKLREGLQRYRSLSIWAAMINFFWW